MIEFYNNQLAPLAGVARRNVPKYITVLGGDDYGQPVSVWRKVAATELDGHMGVNEDGYRWKIVHSGSRPRINQKPF